MTQSVILADVEPGFEDLLFEELQDDNEVSEVHLSTHNNNIYIFAMGKDVPAVEGLVRRLRLKRQVNDVRNAYVVEQAKRGSQPKKDNQRVGLVFASLNPGNEEAAITALKNLKETRDVIALTGPNDLLVTAEVDGAYDLYNFELAVTRAVRHVRGVTSYLTMRSIYREEN